MAQVLAFVLAVSLGTANLDCMVGTDLVAAKVEGQATGSEAGFSHRMVAPNCPSIHLVHHENCQAVDLEAVVTSFHSHVVEVGLSSRAVVVVELAFAFVMEVEEECSLLPPQPQRHGAVPAGTSLVQLPVATMICMLQLVEGRLEYQPSEREVFVDCWR